GREEQRLLAGREVRLRQLRQPARREAGADEALQRGGAQDRAGRDRDARDLPELLEVPGLAADLPGPEGRGVLEGADVGGAWHGAGPPGGASSGTSAGATAGRGPS